MFNRLYGMPEEKRRGVAFLCAVVATVLIVGSWFVAFIEPLSGTEARQGVVGTSSRSIKEALSPLRALGESFTSLTRNVGEELGGVLWGIKATEEKEDEHRKDGVVIVKEAAGSFDATTSPSTLDEYIEHEYVERKEQTQNENINIENEKLDIESSE